MMQNTLNQLHPILAAIEAAGGRALVVGGAVRDLVMGREPKDIDVEVYRLDVDRLLVALAAHGRVNAVGRSFGVLKMRLRDGRELDVSLPRRDSIAGERGALGTPAPDLDPREAAARRDFTWNAMALTPAGDLLDFFGGAEDLRAGIIRHTSEAFGEDPLRVLRAMQFAARFNMRLAPETATVCRALLPTAPALAIERIWGEWHKWALKGRRPSAGLRALAESGWIALYPELVALIGCPQDPEWHPEGDVFIHTLHVCDVAAAVADRDALAGEERVILLFAALCHDLGKPATTTHDPDGRIRSPGHAEAGVPLAEDLLRRIGCPHSLGAPVAPLVREHMAHVGMLPRERSVRRLAVRLAPATIVQWGHLVEADQSGRPPLPPGAPAAPIVELAAQLGAATGQPEPLVKGRHLLAAGMAPGPQFGALLRQAYEAQIEGAFSTVEAGLEWLARNADHPFDFAQGGRRPTTDD